MNINYPLKISIGPTHTNKLHNHNSGNQSTLQKKTCKAFSKKITMILTTVRFKQMLIVEVHLRNKEDISKNNFK